MTSAAAPDYPAGAAPATAAGLTAAGSGNKSGDLLAGRNLSLDFFRGVMALIVCLGHFAFATHMIKFPGSFTLAVDFFLVLSGFVICHSVTRQGERFDAVTFAGRRYFRLAPVYLFCVALFLPLLIYFRLVAAPKFFDIARIVTISEMIPLEPRSKFSIEAAMGHCWTISAEFYIGIMLFPLYAFLLRRARNLIFPAALLAILAPMLILNNVYGYFGNNYAVYGSFFCLGALRCLLDYTVGIVAYRLFLRCARLPAEAALSLMQAGCLIFCCALYATFHYHRHNDMFAPFLFAAFISLLACKGGFVYRLTANRFGRFFGDISYPLYLAHPFLLAFFTLPHIQRHIIRPAVLLLVYLAVCLVFAWLINRLIEKPCLQLLKRQLAGAEN